jgi:hypothetical protein
LLKPKYEATAISTSTISPIWNGDMRPRAFLCSARSE